MTTQANLSRSVELFKAFKTEQTDPDNFYHLLAGDAVGQVASYIPLEGSLVLDVGGGVGYFTDAFREAGARSILVEPTLGEVHSSETGVVTKESAGTPHWVALAPGRQVSAGAIVGDGYCLPFADGAADVCFSSNVLEHVADPTAFIAEMLRVTKPGGVVYVSFTNWYSPWGGHETTPWHYLGGERAAQRYKRRTGFEPVHKFGESLYPVHIGPLLKWARSSPEVVVLKAAPRYYPSWCDWIVQVPGLREVATWNLLLILRRRLST